VEKPIVDTLRAIGWHVTRISGEGAPDILVRKRNDPSGWCQGFEVKSGKGARTAAQDETQWPIVRTVSEALHAIGATK
jgi:hypothetical protein